MVALSHHDVAPEVMEAYRVWFRDLRRRKQQGNNRGHANPVIHLLEDTLPQTTSSSSRQHDESRISEVVDAYSHFVRLEDMKRAAIAQAEMQWREHFSRHGSLPRGPALLAARMVQRMAGNSAALLKLDMDEERQRQHLLSGRESWMREVSLREQYELEGLQELVMRQLKARAAMASNLVPWQESEVFERATIERAGLAMCSSILQAHEVDLARLGAVCRSRAQSVVFMHARFANLFASEAASRNGLIDAEDCHRSTLDHARALQLERLAVATRDVLCSRARQIDTAMGSIEQLETQERDKLCEAAAAHFHDFTIRSALERHAMQRKICQIQSVRDEALGRINHRLDQFMATETAVRVQLIESYLAWAEHVVAPTIVVGRVRQHRVDKTCSEVYRAVSRLMDRFLRSEALERVSIETAWADWYTHVCSLEQLHRIDIPKQVAARALASLQSLREIPKAQQLQMKLEKEEWTVRSQIMLSERKWRVEVAVRMEQLVGGEDIVLRHMMDTLQQERIQRAGIEAAEQRWRQALIQLHVAEMCKLSGGSAKKPVLAKGKK